jgi:CheY-like chemotaxis protein
MSTILLIEDEAAIRRSLTVSLMQEGHEVEPCEDGLTGLAKINSYEVNRKHVDAVILDMILPDIHGLKILGLIKEKHPELPVILITGFGDRSIEEEVKTRQGDFYLEKPIQTEKLDHYLADILKGGKKQAQAPERPKKGITTSGYLFLKLKGESDFYGTFKDLYFDQSVMYCDAVRGAFDIIVLAQGKTQGELRDFVSRCMKKQGVGDALFSPVEEPMLSCDLAKVIDDMDRFLLRKEREKENSGESNYTMYSSYALIEVEPEKFEQVYKNLYFLDNVVSCDALKGPWQILLLLKGPRYDHMEELVSKRIARLDGVLRVSQCPIIKILEM